MAAQLQQLAQQYGFTSEIQRMQDIHIIRLRGVAVWHTTDAGLLSRFLSHPRVASCLHTQDLLADPPFPHEWATCLFRHIEEDGW